MAQLQLHSPAFLDNNLSVQTKRVTLGLPSAFFKAEEWLKHRLLLVVILELPATLNSLARYDLDLTLIRDQMSCSL